MKNQYKHRSKETLLTSQTMASKPFFSPFFTFMAIIPIFLLFPLTSTLPTPYTRTSSNSPHFSKIYAFGDSYTDTGNTKASLPYGITFFHHPSNRFSDGRLVIDFVTEALSLPYLPPYLDQKNHSDSPHGVNFAVAGATAIDHDFFVKHNITLSVVPQSINIELAWFNNYRVSRGCRKPTSEACRGLMKDALFWVGEIGANDYVYTLGSSVPGATIQDLAVKSVTGVVQGLLRMGAKHIVVQGLPMTGCLSLSLTLAPTSDRDELGCVASVNKQSYTHNLLLQSKLQGLRTQYPNAVISYADHWNAYRAIMKNQPGYGFKEPFRACCGSSVGPYNFAPFAFCGSPMAEQPCSNPAQFINWDGVHLTESMYKTVADLLLHRGYCNPSFGALLRSKMGV